MKGPFACDACYRHFQIDKKTSCPTCTIELRELRDLLFPYREKLSFVGLSSELLEKLLTAVDIEQLQARAHILAHLPRTSKGLYATWKGSERSFTDALNHLRKNGVVDFANQRWVKL